jgi:rod shape-determining protein MreD
VKFIVAFVSIVVALTLQSTLFRVEVDGNVSVDLMIVVVTYLALAWGPIPGMLVGSVAGLLQDTLAAGVLGIGGLSKMLVGCLTGVFGQQFNLVAPLPRLVILMAATAVHRVVFVGFHSLLGLHTLPSDSLFVPKRMLVNGVIGLALFLVVEQVPRILEQRRTRRVR